MEAAVHGVAKNWTRLSEWTEEQEITESPEGWLLPVFKEFSVESYFVFFYFSPFYLLLFLSSLQSFSPFGITEGLIVWSQFLDAGITFKPHTLWEYLTKHGIFPLFSQIYLKFSQVADNFSPDHKSKIGSLTKIRKIQKEYWPKKKAQQFVFVSLRGLCFALWDEFVCLCVSLCICLCLCVCVLRTCFEPLSGCTIVFVCESSRIWGHVKVPRNILFP